MQDVCDDNKDEIIKASDDLNKDMGVSGSSEIKEVETKDLSSFLSFESNLESPIERPLEDDFKEVFPGERITQFWMECSGGDVAATSRLLQDCKDVPELASALQKNPLLFRSYLNCIDSRFRTNITVLRYLDRGADINIEGKILARFTGNNLIVKDIDGRTEIQRKDGTVLGELRVDSERQGYRISCTEDGGQILLNKHPLGNCVYQWRNCCWETDKLGRTTKGWITIDDVPQVEQESLRKNDLIRKNRSFKGCYDLLTQTFRFKENPEDDGGHVIADSWGGPSFYINIIPQNSHINRGGLWKSSELQGIGWVGQGYTVSRTVSIDYPNNRSQRPSEYRLVQSIDDREVIRAVFKNG